MVIAFCDFESQYVVSFIETKEVQMLVGYARTSTQEQQAGFDAQLKALQDHGCEKTFSEQVSAVGHRPRLDEALGYVRAGDTLVVTKIDRLARNTVHLLSIVEHLKAKQVALKVLDFGGSAVDTKGPTGMLLLTIFAGFGEFERALMLERQIEGIAKAKGEGKYKGRIPTAKRQSGKVIELHQAGRKPVDIAAELNMSRASVFRILKEHRATAASAA